MQGNKFMKKCIVLMGIKHCGKSTQANFLSEYFKIPSFDTDDLIFELTGKTPRQIYTELGEEGFKKTVERDKLKKEISDNKGIKLVYINYWEEITPRLIDDKIRFC